MGLQEYNWGGLLAFVLQAYAHRRPEWSGVPCGRGLNAAHVLQLMLLALKVADVQFRCAWLPLGTKSLVLMEPFRSHFTTEPVLSHFSARFVRSARGFATELCTD